MVDFLFSLANQARREAHIAMYIIKLSADKKDVVTLRSQANML